MSTPETQLNEYLDKIPVIPFLTICYLFAALSSCTLKQISAHYEEDQPTRTQQAAKISQEQLTTPKAQAEAIDDLFRLYMEECKSNSKSINDLSEIQSHIKTTLQKVTKQNPQAQTHYPTCQ